MISAHGGNFPPGSALYPRRSDMLVEQFAITWLVEAAAPPFRSRVRVLPSSSCSRLGQALAIILTGLSSISAIASRSREHTPRRQPLGRASASVPPIVLVRP